MAQKCFDMLFTIDIFISSFLQKNKPQKNPGQRMLLLVFKVLDYLTTSLIYLMETKHQDTDAVRLVNAPHLSGKGCKIITWKAYLLISQTGLMAGCGFIF